MNVSSPRKILLIAMEDMKLVILESIEPKSLHYSQVGEPTTFAHQAPRDEKKNE